MLLQEVHQVAELGLQRAREARHLADELHDLHLDQRHQQQQHESDGEQEDHQHREAAKGAADAAPLEPLDQGRQHVSEHQPRRERQQNALHEAEQDQRRDQQPDPEGHMVDARDQTAGSTPARIRAQRTKYDAPDKTVVTATAQTKIGVTGPSPNPMPSRASTNETSAICTAVLILLM